MTTIAFDTLKLAKALQDRARFSTEQAEGAASAIAEAMQSDLVTKTDLADVKVEILKWVAGLIGFQTLTIIGAVIALVHLAH